MAPFGKAPQVAGILAAPPCARDPARLAAADTALPWTADWARTRNPKALGPFVPGSGAWGGSQEARRKVRGWIPRAPNRALCAVLFFASRPEALRLKLGLSRKKGGMRGRIASKVIAERRKHHGPPPRRVCDERVAPELRRSNTIAIMLIESSIIRSKQPQCKQTGRVVVLLLVVVAGARPAIPDCCCCCCWWPHPNNRINNTRCPTGPAPTSQERPPWRRG